MFVLRLHGPCASPHYSYADVVELKSSLVLKFARILRPSPPSARVGALGVFDLKFDLERIR